MRRIIGDAKELASVIGHISRGEAEQIRKKASEEADQILRRSETEALDVHNRILREAQRKADQILRRRRAQTVRTEQQEYLRVREDLLDDIWSRAEDRLRALCDDPEQYQEALHRLALLASRILGPGELTLFSEARGEQLLTDQKLRDWGREAGAVFRRGTHQLSTWGGLIAESGGRRVDFTFTTRLALAREEIRQEVFNRLNRM